MLIQCSKFIVPPLRIVASRGKGRVTRGPKCAIDGCDVSTDEGPLSTQRDAVALNCRRRVGSEQKCRRRYFWCDRHHGHRSASAPRTVVLRERRQLLPSGGLGFADTDLLQRWHGRGLRPCRVLISAVATLA